MEKIVMMVQPKFTAYSIHILAVLFAGADAGLPIIGHVTLVGVWTVVPRLISVQIQIFILIFYSLECGHVLSQMYWLLIKKEYIIVLLYIISAITNHAVGITAPKWITHKKSSTRPFVADPRPEGVAVNFVDSNHV
jgi:hypothetical protein